MKSRKNGDLIRKYFASGIQLLSRRKQHGGQMSRPPESVVILARECYGDCILLTPLIAGLKQEYPDLSIYIVAFSRIIQNFFSYDPNVTAVFHAKRQLRRYVHGMLSRQYDLLFNPKDHPSTHFLLQTALIRARYKVGHYHPQHVGLFDHLIRLDRQAHESVRNLSLLDVLNRNRNAATIRPYVPPMPVSEAMSAFLKTMPGKNLAGINLSAGHAGGHRSVEQWSALLARFPDQRFIVIAAPGEQEEKRRLESMHPNVMASPPTKNIYEVASLVKELSLLITPDTSLVHIAACYDTPLIALYRTFVADRTQFGPITTLQEVIVSPTADIADIDNEVTVRTLKQMLERIAQP